MDGHTFDVSGPVYHCILQFHDDRKPLERWVESQLSYSALEARRITSRESYRFRDRLRELGVMPMIVGALAYIRAGGPFRGAAAVRYAYERATYESLLAIRLMSSKLEAKQKPTTEAVPLQTPKLTDPDAKIDQNSSFEVAPAENSMEQGAWSKENRQRGNPPTSKPYRGACSWGGSTCGRYRLVGYTRVFIRGVVESFLVVEDSLRPAAAIVALGGQTPFREMEAANFYRNGLATQVFIVREAPECRIECAKTVGH